MPVINAIDKAILPCRNKLCRRPECLYDVTELDILQFPYKCRTCGIKIKSKQSFGIDNDINAIIEEVWQTYNFSEIICREIEIYKNGSFVPIMPARKLEDLKLKKSAFDKPTLPMWNLYSEDELEGLQKNFKRVILSDNDIMISIFDVYITKKNFMNFEENLKVSWKIIVFFLKYIQKLKNPRIFEKDYFVALQVVISEKGVPRYHFLKGFENLATQEEIEVKFGRIIVIMKYLGRWTIAILSIQKQRCQFYEFLNITSVNSNDFVEFYKRVFREQFSQQDIEFVTSDGIKVGETDCGSALLYTLNELSLSTNLEEHESSRFDVREFRKKMLWLLLKVHFYGPSKVKKPSAPIRRNSNLSSHDTEESNTQRMFEKGGKVNGIWNWTTDPEEKAEIQSIETLDRNFGFQSQGTNSKTMSINNFRAHSINLSGTSSKQRLFLQGQDPTSDPKTLIVGEKVLTKRQLANILQNIKMKVLNEYLEEKGDYADQFYQKYMPEEIDLNEIEISKQSLKQLIKDFEDDLREKLAIEEINETREWMAKQKEYEDKMKAYQALQSLMWYYYYYNPPAYKDLMEEYSRRLSAQLLENLGQPLDELNFAISQSQSNLVLPHNLNLDSKLSSERGSMTSFGKQLENQNSTKTGKSPRGINLLKTKVAELSKTNKSRNSSAKYFNFEKSYAISALDLARLQETNQVNEQIFNMFIGYMRKKALKEENDDYLKRTLFLDCSFFKELTSNADGINYELAKRHTSNWNGKGNTIFENFDRIVAATHSYPNDYSVLLVDLLNTTTFFYNLSSEVDDNVVFAFLKFLKKESLEKRMSPIDVLKWKSHRVEGESPLSEIENGLFSSYYIYSIYRKRDEEPIIRDKVISFKSKLFEVISRICGF